MSAGQDTSTPGVAHGMSTALRTWGEMIKFSHSIFALPFALMAVFLAGRHIAGVGRPLVGQIVLVVVCMVAARSAAMTFNRIVDAAIDARNPRTATRPLPAGTLTLPAAYAFLSLAVVTFGIGCFGFH
ncbi:MAG: UbiA family prenyltransferase, partial [Planctomycetota bacterium]